MGDGKTDVKSDIGPILGGLENVIKGHKELEANRVSGKIVVVHDLRSKILVGKMLP